VPERAADLTARDVGSLQIDDDQIVGFLFRLLQRRIAVGDRVAAEAIEPEVLADRLAQPGFVFDEEDAFGGSFICWNHAGRGCKGKAMKTD
jgi:hypothetical protein